MEKMVLQDFWAAVDAGDEAAAVAFVAHTGTHIASRRPPEAGASLRVAPQTMASIALSRGWQALLLALLDAGLSPHAPENYFSSSLDLITSAVFNVNPLAFDQLVARGVDPCAVVGKGKDRETLWAFLARGSWASCGRDAGLPPGQAVRALADRLLAAGVALAAPGGTGGAWSPALLVARCSSVSSLSRHVPSAVIDVLADPRYGWDWDHPRVAKAASPALLAYLSALRLDRSLPAAAASSRLRI